MARSREMIGGSDASLSAMPLEADIACEVAIVGGGITGALVADMLAGEGASVVIVDRRRFGAGSTVASTALLVYELDTSLCELANMHGAENASRAYRASANALSRLQQTIATLNADCGVARRKSLYLASSPEDARGFDEECAARRAIGINVDVLSSHQVESLLAFRAPAALLSHDGAQCDPWRLTRAMLRRAASRGARLFPETHVTHIESPRTGRSESRPRVRLHTHSGARIVADWAIIATGYECPSPVGLCPRPVGQANSTYVVCSAPLPEQQQWHERWLIWESARPYVYLRTTADGRIIIGGADVPFSNEKARDALLEHQAAQLVRRFHDMFPRIDFQPDFAWTGTFSETDDGFPCIGGLPETPQCLYALGYGGNGITFGLLAAEILRDAVCHAPNEHGDLFAFDRPRVAVTANQ